MTFTYDLNTNGCLILRADPMEREAIKGLANEQGEYTSQAEYEALEGLIDNSELCWIRPEECGDLTDAPILGFRDADGNATDMRWGFMDHALRSFLQDLVETGKAVFTS